MSQPHAGAGQAHKDWGTGMGSGHDYDWCHHKSSDFREAWCEPGVARVAVLGWGLWLVPPREKMVVVAKTVADLPERGGVRALRVTDISSGSYEDLSRRNGG